MHKIELKNLFFKFKTLDEAKLSGPLSRMEEMQWAEYHEIIVNELFKNAYNILLDKRNNIRVPLSIPLEYKTKKGRVKTHTKDISLEGMCLPYDRISTIGEELKIKFLIGYKKWFFTWYKKVKIVGKVNWVKFDIDSMGIQFEDISEKDKKQIFTLIYWHLEKLVEKYEGEEEKDDPNHY